MRRLAVVVLAIIGAFGELTAQQELANPLIPAKSRPRIFVGPVIGYNRSLQSSGFQSISDDVLCPEFTSGVANGYYFGVSAEYLLGEPKNSKSSIIARLVYSYLPGNYAVPGDELPSLDANGNVVVSTTQHVAEIDYTILEFEAIYKLNLFNSGFGIVVGPTLGFVLDVAREQRMELLEPQNAQFDPSLFPNNDYIYINNNRAIITAQDDLPGHSSIRIGLKGGVQYELVMGRVLVVPGISYNFGVTEASADDNLRINALQMGVDIRFAL
jgi:hypothetical protein